MKEKTKRKNFTFCLDYKKDTDRTKMKKEELTLE